MKTLKTFYLFLALVCAGNSFGQIQPDKATTQEYIKKIFADTYGFEHINNYGTIHKLEYSFGDGFGINFFSNSSIIRFGMNAKTDGKCSYAYGFSEVNWAKMQSIEDWKATGTHSPVNVLYINFPANSILRNGYIDSECQEEGFSRYGTEQSVNYILIPYLNQEGVRERLVKALTHLSKLEKEEQAKNDPFGN